MMVSYPTESPAPMNSVAFKGCGDRCQWGNKAQNRWNQQSCRSPNVRDREGTIDFPPVKDSRMIAGEIDVKPSSLFPLTDISVRQIEKNINLGPVSWDFVTIKEQLHAPIHGWWYAATAPQSQLCSKIAYISKVMLRTVWMKRLCLENPSKK